MQGKFFLLHNPVEVEKIARTAGLRVQRFNVDFTTDRDYSNLTPIFLKQAFLVKLSMQRLVNEYGDATPEFITLFEALNRVWAKYAKDRTPNAEILDDIARKGLLVRGSDGLGFPPEGRMAQYKCLVRLYGYSINMAHIVYSTCNRGDMTELYAILAKQMLHRNPK